MGEPGRIQAFLGWWRELPTGWRVNVGLYVLAGVSLIALLTQVVVGGDSRPRRVEVASGRRAPARPTTSAVAPTTTQPPATTVAPTTAPPPTAGRSSPATTRGAAGGGGKSSGGGGSPSPITFAPTTPPVECERNSTDDRCGPFSWDPPPGGNADLSITVTGPTSARVGEQVVFNARVTDPDHLVTGHCRKVDFGDGTGSDGHCDPPPCPPARGVWETPPKQPGSNEFTYAHVFARPGTFEVKFTFHTNKDRCPDPYGSEGTRSVVVTVTPAGT